MMASFGSNLVRNHFSKFSNLMPLAGYEHRLRRIYVVCRRETSLVERKAGSSARIDEQQWLFERHIAERPDERHFDFPSRDRDPQLIAAPIAELQKIVGADVRDQLAERAVQGDHFSTQTLVVHGCGFQIEPDQFLDDGSGLGPVV